MDTFTHKVAVITGAASGIGRGLAHRAVREGMRVVVADIEKTPLADVEQELRAIGGDVLTVTTDVSNAAQVEALAQRAIEHFGQVDLLVNNAGVGAGRGIWESSIADWEWVLSINLWGVIHGLRTFVPLMLAQGTPGYIVNTASAAGLTMYHPLSAPYQVSKHAVVALTEQLRVSLLMQGAPIKASVLCPGLVRSRIFDSERNRPGYERQQASSAAPVPEVLRESMDQVRTSEIDPDQVAKITFDGIRQERLHILTHPELASHIRDRAERILRAVDACTVAL